MGLSITLVLLILVALAFDFMNGLHDAANSIATIVSTRVLKPQYAVVWAAFFNFVAFFIFGVHVANTVGKGIVDPKLVDDPLIFGALMGAISWNAITWWGGIPSSRSHALIGGIVGAGVAKAGFSADHLGRPVARRSIAIVLSPFTGFMLALLLVLLVSWAFVRANPAFADGFFRKSQLVSAALYSLGHGRNDAQKTAGLIAVLLYSHGVYSEFTVPGWVILVLLHGHGHGNADGRLAHRAHHGLQDHPAHPDAGLLRGDGGRHHPVRRHLARHPGVDHPHHHRRHRRAWARRGGCRRCAGTWPRASSMPGSSPCRRRPSSAALFYWLGNAVPLSRNHLFTQYVVKLRLPVVNSDVEPESIALDRCREEAGNEETICRPAVAPQRRRPRGAADLVARHGPLGDPQGLAHQGPHARRRPRRARPMRKRASAAR